MSDYDRNLVSTARATAKGNNCDMMRALLIRLADALEAALVWIDAMNKASMLRQEDDAAR